MRSLLAFAADLARALTVALASRIELSEDERAYRLAQVEDAANEVWDDLTCFIGHMQGWESEWVEYRETELMGGQS